MSPRTEVIMSAGIDIGTSTTKMVISRLSLRNTAGQAHMPRVEITDTEVIYESPIFRTPLESDTSIDMKAVESLILSEYEKAGVSPGDIRTGAVIITGETATKSNARDMISHLSGHAGEFLVATAGPDLESIIAAKGSGAYRLSKETNKTIANVDIGGGTANTAVYRYGRLLGTCTLHVGGKLIEFFEEKVVYTAPAVQKVAEKHHWNLEGGSRNASAIQHTVSYMAETIGKMLNGSLKADDPLLLGKPPEWEVPIDTVIFSGGVAECIYNRDSCDSAGQYDDIGLELADALRKEDTLKDFEWGRPDETVRATVLGAGTETTEISGSTIYVEDSKLPLQNIPVAPFSFEESWERELGKMDAFVEEAVTLYDPGKEGNMFAIYLENIPLLGFRQVQELGDRLSEVYRIYEREHPLLLIMERDLAKSLGQSIRIRHPGQEVVCIDQIKVESGDYIDIGAPFHSQVVPVVIKTLTFH